jgi:tripartite-type tricarboxylate transporter receptor subunit TctC
MAGVEFTHVPYKSSTNAVLDLMEHRIDLQFSILPSTQQQVKTGKLRVLAVTTEKRLDELPDVPTLAESGLAGFEATLWFAVIAPKGVPGAVISRLNREIVSAIAEPDVKNTWAVQGIFPEGSTSVELGERVVRDIAKWRTVVSGLTKKDH